MAVIVVSSCIGVLTRNNIMPFWWKRAQWQEQFPREVTAQCFANMEVIQASHEADDTIRYCPAWSAANKPGRPAKGKRTLSALETAQGMKRKLIFDKILPFIALLAFFHLGSLGIYFDKMDLNFQKTN